MKNKEMFENYITALCELFNHDPLSDMLKNVYWIALEPLSDEQAERTFTAVMKNGKFFPKPVELTSMFQGSIDDHAQIEWVDKVLPAMGHVGSYESVTFDDPVTMAVLDRLGGWVELCNTDNKEMKWVGKEFVKLYKAFASEGITKTGHLPGIIEVENGATGYLEDIPRPKLIGDESKAIAVLGYDPRLMIDKDVDFDPREGE